MSLLEIVRPRVEAVVGSAVGIHGVLHLVHTDGSGRVLLDDYFENLVTQVGDQMYGERGAGVSGAVAVPTGMKLGTGSTAVAKSGSGAALTTYLTGSDQGFDATFPSSALSTGRVITYKTTYAAGTATTASAITEAVIVNDTLANATSTAANTISRVLVTGVPSKGASDTLTATWTHTLLGA